eukprot:COSAG01_NODE_13257_length_1611_cov_1.382275_2_plen_217_part_00
MYFGAFVLKRGIIFIDIALAQWAALGYIVAYAFGVHDGPVLFAFALFFSVFAAFLLSLFKRVYNQVNLQEAVIGVLYISAAALAMGLIASVGLEGHHLKQMFSGQLLFLDGQDVLFSVSLYLLIAVILFFNHSRFSISGSSLSNFCFYALFACVVTSSVKMVGVLLVFSYLVLPVLSLVLFTQRLNLQVFWGGGFGWWGGGGGAWVSVMGRWGPPS